MRIKQKIFISHPYALDPEVNKRKVEVICNQVWRDGYIPISPLHLFSFMTTDEDRVEIMETCKHLMKCCDELWVYGDSRGCIEEARYATKIGLKVVKKY